MSQQLSGIVAGEEVSLISKYCTIFQILNLNYPGFQPTKWIAAERNGYHVIQSLELEPEAS